MKKKIILINPPLTMEERYGSHASAGSELPPLALCNLAAVLRKNDIGVRITDAPACGYNLQDIFNIVKDYEPTLVGITSATISISNSAEVAKYIKGRGCQAPIVLGGPHLTGVSQETMGRFKQFDIGVIGEGEYTILELVQKWEEGVDLSSIPGLIFRSNGNLTSSPKRSFIENLDELPLPAWDLLPNFPEGYSPSALRLKQFPSACTLTSRGCFGQCIFCDTAVFGRKTRYFSAEYVLNMIRELISKYGVKDIAFYDDNFVTPPRRIKQICEKIIEEGLDFTWTCDARVDLIRSIDDLKMFREAGCYQISYGIESGSQGILDFEKKNISIDKVRQIIEWTYKAGIHPKGFFIIGHPTETEETMNKTIRLATELHLQSAHVAYMTPYPGSYINRVADQYGEFQNDWNKMNEWTIVFVPKGLTEEILRKYVKKFYRKFYFRPRIVIGFLKEIRSLRHVLNLLKGFFALVKGLKETGISSRESKS
jgi:radical SAM superfamily enzyme YgiQ (UPF0313 family)